MPGCEISPPAYPLSRDAFKRALMTGHGRALIHAENFDVTDYRDEILDTATDCNFYDTQVDGHREWWLAGLCKCSGLIDTVINLSPDEFHENREQRACLLKEFCLDGHEAALPKLYDMCRRPADSNNVEAISELIEVEGEKGLIFAARQLGNALMADSDFWISDWDLWRFDDLHGPGRAKEILTDAASSDPVIRHFLQKMTAYEDDDYKKSDSISESHAAECVESVIQTILSATKREGWLLRWGRNASSEDRAEVAKLLKSESRATVLVDVLCCLQRNGLPSYDPTLLDLVFHEDDDVRFHAAQVFSHHLESEVRSAGLELLKRGDLEIATELLRRNATEEDSGLILSTLTGNPHDEDNHGTISNLVAMLEDGCSIRGSAIPLYVYEFSSCMHCRGRAIEFLIKWEICPQWLLDEAAFDASEHIRKLVDKSEA